MNSPSPKQHRILIVDDNPAIHEDFRKVFMETGPSENLVRQLESSIFGDTSKFKKRQNFRLESALQGKEGLAKVQAALDHDDPFSLAFVDVRMPPGWDGIETTERLWKIDPDLQVVICTAYSDYSWDDMRRRIGTSDNLLVLKKPFDNIEVIQLAHALTCKWELAKETRSKLQNLENKILSASLNPDGSVAAGSLLTSIRKLVRSSPTPAAILVPALDQMIDANDAFLTLLGCSREEVIQSGMEGHAIIPWQHSSIQGQLLSHIQTGAEVTDYPARILKQGNRGCDVLVSLETIQSAGVSYILILLEEISDRIRKGASYQSP